MSGLFFAWLFCLRSDPIFVQVWVTLSAVLGSKSCISTSSVTFGSDTTKRGGRWRAISSGALWSDRED
jgi:hypothetical protein